MALRKADMEAHHAEYHRLMNEALVAVRRGMYQEAVRLAVCSWDYVDGMMQYARKYEQLDFDSVTSIDLVLKYAPVLFDFEKLNLLDNLLRNQRRIERDTADDLGAMLAEARVLMWDAHRLWTHIENNPDAQEDTLFQALGGRRDRWRAIAEAWDEMGILIRKREKDSCRLSFSTRMGEIVWAKCPRCGKQAEAPKAMFLEPLKCPGCGDATLFVILAGSAAAKE